MSSSDNFVLPLLCSIGSSLEAYASLLENQPILSEVCILLLTIVPKNHTEGSLRLVDPSSQTGSPLRRSYVSPLLFVYLSGLIAAKWKFWDKKLFRCYMRTFFLATCSNRSFQAPARLLSSARRLRAEPGFDEGERLSITLSGINPGVYVDGRYSKADDTRRPSFLRIPCRRPHRCRSQTR